MGLERMGYESLLSYQNDDAPPSDHDVMVHVVPETNKNRWNHVEDLDSFFTRIYFYHQKHGFLCILLQEIFELLQFVFVVVFATFLIGCVDYDILFKNRFPPHFNATDPGAKVNLHDAVIGQCVSTFGLGMWSVLIVAIIFWLLRLVFVLYNTVLNWEIRAFYRTALGIHDGELENLTWHDVQKRLRDVQREQQMCIHKQDLTELDIYHRILRFKNYMVAMTNKNVLPLRHWLPFIGDVVFLTHGLKYNLEMILFWGPWAPFESSWHLREDYKKSAKRKELAAALSKRILWVGIANLILSPLIFLWQILYSFFNYAEVVKREPGSLGMRRWSLYGRLFLRHFNELEHEINARLTRAYRPASKYMGIFNTPILAILAQNIAFVAGAIFAVLSALAVWDEDVLTLEHVLLLLTVLGGTIAVCRSFIPDEQLVWCPEKLLTAVLAHVHYFPDQWKGQAHTTRTRDQFALLFQYKAVYLLEELLSPFVTPLVLIFYMQPKALDIVDFYRNFTVEVIGVGDVCSFAQMDVRKHGHPAWQASVIEDKDNSEGGGPGRTSDTRAENGKTELSLVHFTYTNPDWRPPQDSNTYIAHLKERAVRDATTLATVMEENPLLASLNSLSSVGNEYSNVATSLFMENRMLNTSLPPANMTQQYSGGFLQQSGSNDPRSFRGCINKHEGPLQGPQRPLASLIVQNGTFAGQQTLSFANSFAQYPTSTCPRGPGSTDVINFEGNAVDMSLNALYLHELHHQELRRRGPRAFPGGTVSGINESAAAGSSTMRLMPQLHSHHVPSTSSTTTTQSEKTPLLSQQHSSGSGSSG